jgi:tyrosyl-tRNA synthetase
VGLASCLTAAGLTGSNSEAMRLIKQGAVWLDDQQVTDPKAAVDPAAAGGSVLRVGKKKWTRLQFEDAPDAR